MKKYKEITLMSAFLCMAVIMIHITATPVTSLIKGSIQHIAMFALNRGLTFAVPAFIFLSGFKLYSKYGRQKMSLSEFLRGRLLKIVVPYLISVAVYFVCMYARGWATLVKIPEYIFLGTLQAHFYYIVIAVQLYLLFPLIKWLFDRLPILVLIVSLASTLWLNQFFWFTYSDRFFATYLFYFVLGMLLAKYKLYERSKLFCILSLVGTFAVGVPHFTVLYIAEYKNVMYKYAGAINVLYYTVAIFAMISAFKWIGDKCEGVYKFARVLDGASFEIYLYHLLLLMFIQSGVSKWLDLSVRYEFILAFVSLFGAAFVFAFLKYKLKENRKNKKTAV